MSNGEEIMKYYIVYNATGEILRSGVTAPETFSDQAQPGEFVMEGKADDELQYIDIPSGQIHLKSTINAVADKLTLIGNGVDSVTISNLPNPTEVDIRGIAEYTITDGIFEFTVDAPGSYIIICKSVLHLDKEFDINAS